MAKYYSPSAVSHQDMIIDFKDYESLFNEKAHLKYRGESSVMYLSFPEIAIKNIKHYLDDDIIFALITDDIDNTKYLNTLSEEGDI